MSDWIPAIKASAQVMCKSTTDENVYATCIDGKLVPYTCLTQSR